MDIKDLNKNQMVLLTLLLSFVTSIAMAVITVSLLQENPTTVTQTINRVVERTVEKVVPVVSGGKSTVTKETTIVVKEEDLITKSIDQNKNKIVAVREKAIGADGVATHTFLGWGIVFNKDGVIATDSSFIADSGAYTILTEDGVSFETKILDQNEIMGVAFLSAVREKGNKERESYDFTPASSVNSDSIKLGQTLIAFGGKNRKAVSIGIVGNIINKEISGELSTSTSATKKLDSIEGNVFPPNKVTGGPVMNSFGEVIGMAVSVLWAGGDAIYLPFSIVSELFSAIPK
ncbi:MAG: serine protease [Patescibacteria group bacterium]